VPNGIITGGQKFGQRYGTTSLNVFVISSFGFDNCPIGVTFSGHGLGKSLVPIYCLCLGAFVAMFSGLSELGIKYLMGHLSNFWRNENGF